MIWIIFLGNEFPVGLYLRSFCCALDEILEPYRKSLIRIEKELLADPHLTAAYVQTSLEEVSQVSMCSVQNR